MKNYLIGLLLLFSITANAQWPKGLPSPYSNGFIQHGYIKADSALILANRDTSWTPRFPGTVVRWKHAGVDTLLWVWDGEWRALAAGTNNGGGSGSGGTVTSVATNAATGITGGTITTTGTLSIDTTLIETRKDRDKLKDSLLTLIAATGGGTVTSVAKGFGIVHDGTITTTGIINADSTVLSTKANVQKVKDSLQTQITTNTTNIAANTTSITNNLTRLINDSIYLKGLIDATNGTVTSVATNTGTGITGGTITASGTLAIDTFKISTRANRDKLKDSLQANININSTAITTLQNAGYISNITGLVTAGTNITVTGGGTSGSPYVINASTGTTQSTSYQTATATASQTAFTFTSVPSTNSDFSIFINGMFIAPAFYTVSTNTITFSSGLASGDIVNFHRIK